jgi:hypothetical protein
MVQPKLLKDFGVTWVSVTTCSYASLPLTGSHQNKYSQNTKNGDIHLSVVRKRGRFGTKCRHVRAGSGD